MTANGKSDPARKDDKSNDKDTGGPGRPLGTEAVNRFERPTGPRPPIDRPNNAYPLTDAADVAAIRREVAHRVIYYALGGRVLDQAREELAFVTALGADPDWLSEAEAYGSYADYLADREAFDRGDYDDDPFREVD